MKRLLIFYSHFYPAFKAGGPVQSLVNLVETMRKDLRIYVFCSAYDLGDESVLRDIQPDAWNDLGENIEVYYVDKAVRSAIQQTFKERKPDIVYINGMFLPLYNWLPLWLAKSNGIKVVLAPRGMLQKGALAIKPAKKKLFLALFKLSGLYKNILWHATDEQEKEDIKHIFGENSAVKVAFNIPRIPYAKTIFREKRASRLKIIYLSLITEKKNLHLILKALKEIKTPVEFDIYGPVKDESYWKKCQQLIEGQIHRIHYSGLVDPSEVQKLLSEYHLFVLPTKGENFGHAIYEALSVGTPAMISRFTPWGRLQDHRAGMTIESETEQDWSTAIRMFIDYDQNEFDKLSQGAHALASNYFYGNDFKSAYKELFDISSE